MSINGLDGVDVGGHVGVEPVTVAGQVHVVEVQEHRVRIAAAQYGSGHVGNGLVARGVDGFIDHVALDVVVYGRPMANGVGVQIRIDGFQTF